MRIWEYRHANMTSVLFIHLVWGRLSADRGVKRSGISGRIEELAAVIPSIDSLHGGQQKRKELVLGGPCALRDNFSRRASGRTRGGAKRLGSNRGLPHVRICAHNNGDCLKRSLEKAIPRSDRASRMCRKIERRCQSL